MLFDPYPMNDAQLTATAVNYLILQLNYLQIAQIDPKAKICKRVQSPRNKS